MTVLIIYLMSLMASACDAMAFTHDLEHLVRTGAVLSDHDHSAIDTPYGGNDADPAADAVHQLMHVAGHGQASLSGSNQASVLHVSSGLPCAVAEWLARSQIYHEPSIRPPRPANRLL